MLARRKLEAHLKMSNPEFWPVMLSAMDLLDEDDRMPGHLRPFDRTITNAQAAGDAKTVFLIWLADKAFGTSNHGDSLPCSDDEMSEVFFPEWPDPDDDLDEEVRIEAQILAEIDMAQAKSLCSECPMRVECLAASLGISGSGQKLGKPADEGQILGGWGSNARNMIYNNFLELKRAYQRGAPERTWAAASSKKVSMDATEREFYEGLAQQLISGTKGITSQVRRSLAR